MSQGDDEEEDPVEAAKDTLASLKKMLGIEEQVQPPDGVWFDTFKTNPDTKKREFMGRVLVSLELMHKSLVDKVPAGLGRSDPNLNPTLPPPNGRLKFVSGCGCVSVRTCVCLKSCMSPSLPPLPQSLNPFKMFTQFLGPGLCFKFCCCFITLAILVACVFLAPFLNIVIAW